MTKYVMGAPRQQFSSRTEVGSGPLSMSKDVREGARPSHRVRFSVIAHQFDSHPIVHECEWSELVASMSVYDYRTDKRWGPLVSPAEFFADTSGEPCDCKQCLKVSPTGQVGTIRKRKTCVGPVSFLALDFDDVQPEAVIAVLNLVDSLNLSAFAYSTWKQPEAAQKGLARVRLFILVSRRVQPEEWPTFYRASAQRFGASMADDTADEPTRFYFTPALPAYADGTTASAHAQWWTSSGYQNGSAVPWDVDDVLRNAPELETELPPIVRHAEEPVSRARVKKLATALCSGETGWLGNAMLNALEGERMAAPSKRHDVMRSLTMRLAIAFPYASGESLAEHFSSSFAAMDRDGVQHPSREHFLKLFQSAQSKVHADLAKRAADGLIYDKHGQLVPNLANLLKLMTAPEWSGVLEFNEFANEIAKRRPPPCRAEDRPEKESPHLTETDAVRIAAWFQSSAHRLNVTPELVLQASYSVAERKTFHPVREWLESLTWDGVSRLDALPGYFGAADIIYNREVLARFMIAAVARVHDPGCKVDTVLCLVGDQGKKKSTALGILAGPADWFSDSQIDLDNKDGMQALRGKWIVEIPELDSFKGKSATRIKAFASSKIDNYRPSYARQTRAFPRHCVFAATTNEEQFLTDQTGNRRFWPVTCGAIDLERLANDRTALWAEAVQQYRAGKAWWLQGSELESSAVEQQDAHTEQDPWLVLLARWIAREQAGKDGFSFVMTDALELALHIPRAQQNRHAQTRAGVLAGKLGWSARLTREGGGKRSRRYELVSDERWTSAVAEFELDTNPAKVRVESVVEASAAPSVANAWAAPRPTLKATA